MEFAITSFQFCIKRMRFILKLIKIVHRIFHPDMKKYLSSDSNFFFFLVKGVDNIFREILNSSLYVFYTYAYRERISMEEVEAVENWHAVIQA